MCIRDRSNLRILSLQFRNLVSSESGMLAAELYSGKVPAGEMIGTANLLRGRSIQIWSPLELGTRRLGDEDSSLALEKVRTALFARLHPLHDEIIRSASSNRPAPIGIEHYLAVSVSALESSDELADGISRAAAAYTNKLLEQARQQERVALASIIAILIVAGLVVMLLVWRFTRPLDKVLGRIDRLLGLQAGSSPLVRSTLGSSEFARVEQALEVLEQTMQARLRSEEAFKESERMSTSILACVPQSIIATDVNGAPGSCLAFDSLVTAGYYNGKAFHRMVPNFVVQGGCPRGDGYGGMPWTLRTEICHNLFSTGSLGLASAGRDTESCQFFITHSATPHLDGRYTRFGEVVKGMSVVLKLQVGDVMESIERTAK